MSLFSSGLKVRPFEVATDVPRLLQLLREAEAVDATGQLVSEENIRLYLSVPQHNSITDRWVIEDPNNAALLIAHAAINLPAQSDDRRIADAMLTVHPAWRRNGLGTHLLSHIEARLGEAKSSTHLLRLYVEPKHAAAVAFVQAMGFKPFGADTYTEMRAVVEDVATHTTLPEGFYLRTYREVDNLAVLVDALNRGYAGLQGHHQTSVEEFAPWLDELDWDGLLLLFGPDGNVIGTGGASLAPDRTLRNGLPTGQVDSPGVVPEHRSLPLYEALLLAGVAYLDKHGMIWAELQSWGDSAAVLNHYQSLGFRVLRQELAYHRTVGTQS